MHDETSIEATRWRMVRELAKARNAAEKTVWRVTELHDRAEEAIRGRNRGEVGDWARGLEEDPGTRFLALGTTGLEDPVDVVAAVVLDGAGETVFSERVRPAPFVQGGPIDVEPGAARMHGHTAATLADAPTVAEVWPELQKWLEGRRVVVYNGPWVERVLTQTVDRYRLSLPQIALECAMDAYSRVAGEWSLEGQYYYSVGLPGGDGTPGGNAQALFELLTELAGGHPPISSGFGGRSGRREEADINEEDFMDIPFKSRFPACVRYPLVF